MPETSLTKNIQGTYGTMYYVTDMQKSVAFYKEVCGLKPSFESPDWTEFPLGSHSLCLHSLKPGEASRGVGLLIIRVKELSSVVADLKGRSVPFNRDVNEVHPGAFAADFQDPDGNIVSLYQGPAV